MSSNHLDSPASVPHPAEMSELHPAGRIALAQIVIVLLGGAACMISMFFAPDTDWTRPALIFKYGYWLILFLPPLWALLAVRLENRPQSRWSPTWTLVSGFGLTILLVAFFASVAIQPCRPGVRPLRANAIQ